MRPLHYKTAHWVNKGVFDSLSSFLDFESRINDIIEEKDRGDVFEIFIEVFVATFGLAVVFAFGFTTLAFGLETFFLTLVVLGIFEI